jgi:hypothetical protein
MTAQSPEATKEVWLWRCAISFAWGFFCCVVVLALMGLIK